MKKLILSLLLVCSIGLFAGTLFGQGAFVRVGLGYGFSMGSIVMTTNYTEDDDLYEAVTGTLGKGLNIGAAFGYMFNKNVGAELGVNYLLGGKVKGFYDTDNLIEDYDLSAKMLRLMPSLVISSGLEKIEPYARFGLVIGIGSITDNEALEYTNWDVEASMKIKKKGGLAIGLNAGLGVRYNLSESMAIFGELAMINMSYSPTKGEVTEFIVDGDDELDELDTSDREFEYVKELEYDDDPPSSRPSQDLITKFPMGSLGPNFGILISL